jgi:nitrile hydratase beta subunit
MDGIHDMGGMQGFGPVPIEHNETLFKTPWEGRVLAMRIATALHTGANVDRFRHLIECMPPASYLNASYYQRWLHGMLDHFLETGILADTDLTAIRAGDSPAADNAQSAAAIPAEQMRALLSHYSAPATDQPVPARFRIGETVRARNIHPPGHSRLPGYARGKAGEIVATHGLHLFADDRGSGLGDTLQHLYTLKFMATELWGENANPRDCVNLELWESHLEQP